jgi:hypothetical protein
MDNPEKTEGAIKNGQSRENRRGNQEWTIQRKQKGQSRMDIKALSICIVIINSKQQYGKR